MNVKLFRSLCFLVLLGLVRGAAVGKDDEVIKEEDELIYGDLGDPDTPKDQAAHDEDYYDETDDDKKVGQSILIDDNDVNVKLVTKAEHLVKNIGDTVRLPCQVDDKKADVIRSWFRNNQALYQGQVAVNKIDNIRTNGSFLEVKIMNDLDFGEYNCSLVLREHMNPYVVHTVSPPQEPRIIQLITSANKTVYREGESLGLICRATGSPRPKITWSRRGERLATGEQLSFEKLNGGQDGSYQCLADNKVGQAAHGHITITVQRKPKIAVEKLFINSEHKHQTELICHIDAEPMASVEWKKNGVVIPDDVNKYRRTLTKKKSVLLIKNVDESDFGEYSCNARNDLGEAEQLVRLVKLPVVLEFQKPTADSKDVVLTWKVESRQPISQHELQYRKKGEDSWKTITPQVGDPENDVYLIKQTLSGLEPGIYETRARSRNNHGWSNYSDIMPFEGVLANHGNQHQRKPSRNKDKKPKDQLPTSAQANEETPVGATSGTWSPSASLALLISAISLSILLQHRP